MQAVSESDGIQALKPGSPPLSDHIGLKTIPHTWSPCPALGTFVMSASLSPEMRLGLRSLYKGL